MALSNARNKPARIPTPAMTPRREAVLHGVSTTSSRIQPMQHIESSKHEAERILNTVADLRSRLVSIGLSVGANFPPSDANATGSGDSPSATGSLYSLRHTLAMTMEQLEEMSGAISAIEDVLV